MTKRFTAAALATLGAACALQAQPQKMNVVLILADDLGWSDVTLYGTTDFYKTPNLERLAARGMTFSQAYSASPLSSPTRSSIMTGQTPAMTGITTPMCHIGQVILKPSAPEKGMPHLRSVPCVSATRLSTDLPTLPKLIGRAGYQTAHFGKWHLGPEPYSALEQGFQVDIPHFSGPGPSTYGGPWNYLSNFPKKYPGENIEDRMAEEAVNWLRGRDPKAPFYMNFWQFSIHGPWNGKEEYIEAFRQQIDMKSPQRSPTYAAMVRTMDEAVGTLLDEIDRQGIADQTIIIFYSDNGANASNTLKEKDKDGKEFSTLASSNLPLRSGKGTVWEGGIRVPCVVVWPGVTRPGSKSDCRIQSTDLYPTLLAALGIPAPENHTIEGVDFNAALRGKKFDRGPMFTYYPQTLNVLDWLPPAVTVHSGDWKLIRLFHCGEDGGHAYRLYNLKKDIGEKNDLSASNPKKVRELDQLIEAYLTRTEAVTPKPNSAWDPSAASQVKWGVPIPPKGLKLAGFH